MREHNLHEQIWKMHLWWNNLINQIYSLKLNLPEAFTPFTMETYDSDMMI